MSRPEIKWADVLPLLQRWGLDPCQVRTVTWSVDGVHVEVFQHNREGRKFVNPGADDAAMSNYYAPRFKGR